MIALTMSPEVNGERLSIGPNGNHIKAANPR